MANYTSHDIARVINKLEIALRCRTENRCIVGVPTVKSALEMLRAELHTQENCENILERQNGQA